MKKPTRARKVQDLPSPYRLQLNSYALAASAAGLSLLAPARPMEAKIIYTSTHHVIREGDSYSLDITGDGKTNLTFQNKHFSSCSTGGSCRSSQSLSANVAASAQAVHNYFGAVAMKPGMWIGPKHAFQGGLSLWPDSEDQITEAGSMSRTATWE